MATDNLTLARPYAKAVFELALEKQSFAQWTALLQTAAIVCLDERVAKLIANPLVSTEKVTELFLGVCEKVLDEQGKRFIQVLASNKRLGLLPEIEVLYEAYRAEHEKVLEVDVATFMPMSDDEQQQLQVALQQRFQKQVSLKCSIDKDLIGGAVIVADGLVIDGSVRGKLQRMASNIAA